MEKITYAHLLNFKSAIIYLASENVFKNIAQHRANQEFAGLHGPFPPKITGSTTTKKLLQRKSFPRLKVSKIKQHFAILVLI